MVEMEFLFFLLHVLGTPDVCLVDWAYLSLDAALIFSQIEITFQPFFFFFCSVCEILNMFLARPLDYTAVGKRSSSTVPWYQR